MLLMIYGVFIFVGALLNSLLCYRIGNNSYKIRLVKFLWDTGLEEEVINCVVRDVERKTKDVGRDSKE